MSLILDALRKAERQHKLGEVPGIGASMTDEPIRTRWFGLLLTFMLALAMLVLGLYLGGNNTSEQEIIPEAAEISVQESDIKLAEPLKTAPVEPQPDVVIEAQKSTHQVEPVVAEPLVMPAKTTPQVPERITPPPQAPAPAQQLSELPMGFVENLPTLNIDIHSFDGRPGRSYVLINMEKYREGAYLKEGPLLSEILRDGVILEHMGERFILPIGNN